MTNCENDSRLLNENLPEFACRLCCCKVEQAVDAELADVTVPEHGSMFKTELYEVIKLKKRKFKHYKPKNLLAKRGNSVLHRLPPFRIQPHEKSIGCF